MTLQTNFLKTTYNSTGIQNEININPARFVSLSVLADPATEYTLEYKISPDLSATWRVAPETSNMTGNRVLANDTPIFALRFNVISLVGVVDLELQLI